MGANLSFMSWMRCSVERMQTSQLGLRTKVRGTVHR
jgi:hypothetical protein